MTLNTRVREAFIDVGGTRTRYLEAGSGMPLVLLHAVGMCAETFYPNLAGLSDMFRVIAVDLPGHGFTDSLVVEGEAPQHTFSSHMLALMDALGIERFAVAGSSFGGLVAALTYFKAPDRVVALGLIGCGSVFHSAEAQKKGFVGTRANGSKAMQNPSLEACYQRLKNIVFDGFCIPHAVVAAQSAIYAKPDRLPAYEAVLDGTVSFLDDPNARVLSRLEQIQSPTWVIVGRNDIRADWQNHVDGASRIPNATVQIYEECGHLPYLEHPHRFNRDVTAFLTGLAS